MSFDMTSLGAPTAIDKRGLERFFGRHDLLPLWIAEPYVPLAPTVVDALKKRAGEGWYGYETRPPRVRESFWEWMERRHGWEPAGLHTLVSPSVGASMAIIVDLLTEPGNGVILQPPVFTEFKPLIRRLDRVPVRNSLQLEADRYRMDLDDLESQAAESSTKVMILCNPHNPVGRVWTEEELRSVAEICAANDVFVISDEIHGDLALPSNPFTPFARIAPATGVSWAATHGPIKTFGLAGVADTLLITDDEDLAGQFRSATRRSHMTRNNVFALAATRAGYSGGGEWLDGLLDLIDKNARLLSEGLPEPVKLIEPQGTYLAWLDFRGLGMEVPELTEWLSSKARLALSPGHWFGREGAGFARMTVAVDHAVIEEAIGRIDGAV